MNRLCGFILLGVFLLNTGSAFAERGESGGDSSNRAVNINLGSSGVALDDAAYGFWTYLAWHIPGQSAPPRFGSQSSAGSSMQTFP